jgi:hypothetical protein
MKRTFNHIYHTESQWIPDRLPKRGKAKHEGHFRISLFKGEERSKVEIKREWIVDIKFNLGVVLEKDVNVVYGLHHNTISVNFLLKKDMETVKNTILEYLESVTKQ